MSSRGSSALKGTVDSFFKGTLHPKIQKDVFVLLVLLLIHVDCFGNLLNTTGLDVSSCGAMTGNT